MSLQTELEQLVLQPADVGSGFVQFDEGRQGIADTGGDPAQFDRVEGWKARYRADTNAIRGPLVIASLVDLFESSDGADDDLEALREERISPESGWQPAEDPGLGDESFALTLVQGIGARAVRSYLVAWRRGELTGSVDVNGFERGLTLDDAVALAQKQARRMDEAA